MQQIERYGVIVLLFMLVTILVVSLWDGEASEQDTGRASSVVAAAETARSESPRGARQTPAGRQSSATRGQADRPVSFPAEPRETETAPLASARDRYSARGSRGDRRDRSSRQGLSGTPSPQTHTLGTPRPDSSPSGSAANQALTDTTGLSRRPSIPRTAGPIESPIESPVETPAARGTEAVAARESRPTTSSSTSSGRRRSNRRSSPSTSNTTPAVSSTVTPAQPSAEATASGRTSGWSYEIKSGDTLQKIASRVLGDGGRWREIQDANPGLDPLKLFVGARIQLPGSASSPSRKASETPAKGRSQRVAGSSGDYLVKKGDVLSRIAQRELGSSKRWREIVELNPGLDPNRLLVGARLRLPVPKSVPARVVSPRKSTEALAQAAPSRSQGASTSYKVR